AVCRRVHAPDPASPGPCHSPGSLVGAGHARGCAGGGHSAATRGGAVPAGGRRGFCHRAVADPGPRPCPSAGCPAGHSGGPPRDRRYDQRQARVRRERRRGNLCLPWRSHSGTVAKSTPATHNAWPCPIRAGRSAGNNPHTRKFQMRHFLRPTLQATALAVALGMTASVCAQTTAASGTATGDKAKVSYVVGYQMASQLQPIMREELDPTIVANAVKAALSGQKPTMSDDEAKQVMEPFMAKMQTKYKAEVAKLAAKNKAEGDAFLAKNKTQPGVKTTASGLQYQVIKAGTGARPGPTDTVEIDYTGSF